MYKTKAQNKKRKKDKTCSKSNGAAKVGKVKNKKTVNKKLFPM